MKKDSADPQSRRRSSVRDLLAEKSHATRKSSNSGMESSVLRFKGVNFVVGKGEKEKQILTNVSGTVRFGHVMALMGPSGAGKTTLINALTLDAFYGTAYGSLTLNGVPLTNEIFKDHCYIVKQHDKHWPYLTVREILSYCAELFDVATTKEDISEIVDGIISSMGMDSCADTRSARISGGQARRLSVAIALLKQPTLLFLDEPTTGLDAAAAQSVMAEIIRVAKDERLIVICTIHQPSTKVYSSFDKVMVLSKGREAFTGDVSKAVSYFDSIGYPLPPATNPAEHFLDLTNADFSSSEEVDKLLDTWQEKNANIGASSHGGSAKGFGGEEDSEQEGIVGAEGISTYKEIKIMFRRHSLLIWRDPILYLGRCIAILISCIIFSIVYISSREPDQDQTKNKMFLVTWLFSIPANLGVIAVYALNDEFKNILRETKNGMVNSTSYTLAKTVLVIPIMYIFSLFALGIPAYAMQDYPASTFGLLTALWSVHYYIYENFAELQAVANEDPIMGMLNFMNFWFAAFLFGGFLLPVDDIIWPFKIFYYIMPYNYYLRAFVYILFTETTWNSCDPEEVKDSPVCVNSTDGLAVLGGLEELYPVLSTEDTVAQDAAVLFGMAIFYKLCTLILIKIKTSQSYAFKEKQV